MFDSKGARLFLKIWYVGFAIAAALVLLLKVAPATATATAFHSNLITLLCFVSLLGYVQSVATEAKLELLEKLQGGGGASSS